MKKNLNKILINKIVRKLLKEILYINIYNG